MDGRIEEGGAVTPDFGPERPMSRRAGFQCGSTNRRASGRKKRFGPQGEDAKCKRN